MGRASASGRDGEPGQSRESLRTLVYAARSPPLSTGRRRSGRLEGDSDRGQRGGRRRRQPTDQPRRAASAVSTASMCSERWIDRSSSAGRSDRIDAAAASTRRPAMIEFTASAAASVSVTAVRPAPRANASQAGGNASLSRSATSSRRGAGCAAGPTASAVRQRLASSRSQNARCPEPGRPSRRRRRPAGPGRPGRAPRAARAGGRGSPRCAPGRSGRPSAPPDERLWRPRRSRPGLAHLGD